jgi:hypothetical protein
MGTLLSGFKKSVIEDIQNSINTNTAYYYAFASYSNNIPSSSADESFINEWNMMFGKQISSGDIFPVINNIIWSSNTVYSMYNNNVDLSNTNFYVVSQLGTSYHIYKCIDNANNSPSTSNPVSITVPTQSITFQTSDNYKWRYITTINTQNYNKFATSNFVPIYANTSIQISAAENAGIDNILISNSGNGYETYHNGTVQSVNTNIIQIESSANTSNTYYKNNSIYLYNNANPTSAQLLFITDYVSNSSGKWVFTNNVNTSLIQTGITQYIISPTVLFNCDGDVYPQAYTTINTVSNSIANVVIINGGSNISWATATIVSNTHYGSGANLQTIVPPVGGHGADPSSELFVQGMAVSFIFANSEANTISTNISYNRIGLIKNPNSITNTGSEGISYTSNTFNQLLEANLSPVLSTPYTVGDTVIGNTSGSVGTVVFCNTSTIFLVGDKTFSNNEYINNPSNTISSGISINTLGSIYTKDTKSIYTQSINTVNRLSTQNEAFKLIIQF